MKEEQKIDRPYYKRLLNQAFEEGKELQRLEDIIFRVRQLASKKRTKVKNLETQAENLERARLMTEAKNEKPAKKSSTKVSFNSFKKFLTTKEFEALEKGGKND